MESIYDALYNYAQNRQDLTRWLHDEDIVKDYQECLEYSTRQEKQLMEALDDPARKQFEIYIGNVQGVRDYERMMRTIAEFEDQGMTHDQAETEAFYANTRE